MKNNLTKYRELAKLSMRQLAIKAGMSAMQISRLESGENQFTHKNLIKLSNALEINPEDLIREINHPTTINNEEICHLKLCNDLSMLSLDDSKKKFTETLPVLKSTLNYMKIFDINYIIAYKVEDYSFSSVIKYGDILFIDISVNNIDTDIGLYCFSYDKIVYLKRIQKIPNKLLIIADSHTEQYSNWEIKLPSRKIKIIGKLKGKLSITRF